MTARNQMLAAATIIWAALASAGIGAAQDSQHTHQHVQDTISVEALAHAHHAAGEQNRAESAGSNSGPDAEGYLLGLSSGTSLNPAAWSMPMAMNSLGNWNLMWMGEATLLNTQQTGPRGTDKFYSANWGMLAAARRLGKGSIMLRAMVSLEPLTVVDRRYPLLFQTGEAAYGTPIVDGQHPHDLLMEMGVHYARPLGRHSLLSFYYAPVGDPALGPVAFPHRASAAEIPQATLGHHWQDATHISNNVFTAGLTYRRIRLEASGFRGREPNENRWNIDMGKMDSWSSRITLQANRNWVAQASVARIERPETFHADDVVRVTASVHFVRPQRDQRDLAASIIWARNYKTIGKYATQSFLSEAVLPVTSKGAITGRYEWSQRDELFEYDHSLAHIIFETTGKRAFDVHAYTLGYSHLLARSRSVESTLGFNATFYGIGRELRPFYGDRPAGFTAFVRFRLNREEN